MRTGHATFIVTAQSAKFNCCKKIATMCVGGAKWEPFSSPVNATLVLVGVLGECFKLNWRSDPLLLLNWF